jgi:hypothetical protein
VATQTATTGQLEDAQAIVIAECKYTMEHNAPCRNLITQYKLGHGEKQITVPKVAQMSAADLVDGTDMTATADIGMTSTDLTCAEVGLKVILTDKLVRQEKPDVFTVVGRQMGDAIARAIDEDIIALFDGFSHDAGASGAGLNFRSFAAMSSWMKTQKAPRPWAFVHHPYAIFNLMRDTSKIGAAAGNTIPHGYSEDLLKDFWAITIDQIPVFDDGNITAGVASKGGMFSKDALCIVESLAPNTERERDASLRATELVMVTDYGCFELDDDYGVEAQYSSATPSTSST